MKMYNSLFKGYEIVDDIDAIKCFKQCSTKLLNTIHNADHLLWITCDNTNDIINDKLEDYFV